MLSFINDVVGIVFPVLLVLLALMGIDLYRRGMKSLEIPIDWGAQDYTDQLLRIEQKIDQFTQLLEDEKENREN